jgi:hypothetical protein
MIGKVCVLAAVIVSAVPACAADMVSQLVTARAAVDRGDWKAALAPLALLTTQSPLNGEFRLSLARARYYTGDFAGAEADYKTAFDLKAEDPAVLAGRLAGRFFRFPRAGYFCAGDLRRYGCGPRCGDGHDQGAVIAGRVDLLPLTACEYGKRVSCRL